MKFRPKKSKHFFFNSSYINSKQAFISLLTVPPAEPLNVKFGRITSNSLQILWRPGFDGYSPIISYTLEIRANSTFDWTTVSEQITSESYIVHDLKPYTIYVVRVFARNKIGRSESSESIWNRTDEDGK